MASPNNPISSAELIRRYSKAMVVTASRKQFVIGTNMLSLENTFSRQLTDADVHESLVRKYC